MLVSRIDHLNNTATAANGQDLRPVNTTNVRIYLLVYTTYTLSDKSFDCADVV